MRKRRVEPDSPQSRRGREGVGRFMVRPCTVRVDPDQVKEAPRASMHRMVARMSWDGATWVSTLSPEARAAAMMSRWAWLLEGGGVTGP